MITVTASNLKNNFGYYLDSALFDGEVLITRHGRVVAKLVAYKEGQKATKQKVPTNGSKSTLWNGFSHFRAFLWVKYTNSWGQINGFKPSQIGLKSFTMIV